MLKVKLERNPEPHDWFAWYPVIATKQTDTGLEYYLVLFSTVRRKYVRAAGVSHCTYEI